VLAERTRIAPGLVPGAAALTMGLLAGFFYAYSASVMPGLAQADDRTIVDAMQQINEGVENPVIFLSFLASTAALGCLVYACSFTGEPEEVKVGAARPCTQTTTFQSPSTV
jgi:uncharacterized membrane protein